MPDLNWELWRLRQSDEVARRLRAETVTVEVRARRVWLAVPLLRFAGWFPPRLARRLANAVLRLVRLECREEGRRRWWRLRDRPLTLADFGE
jgi:hypothetical protein